MCTSIGKVIVYPLVIFLLVWLPNWEGFLSYPRNTSPWLQSGWRLSSQLSLVYLNTNDNVPCNKILRAIIWLKHCYINLAFENLSGWSGLHIYWPVRYIKYWAEYKLETKTSLLNLIHFLPNWTILLFYWSYIVIALYKV